MIAYEYIAFFTSVLAIILIKKITEPSPKPIFNIYREPGNFYWLKVLFIYTILSLRKLKPRKVNYADYEKPQKLSCSTKPIDAVYFNCSNSDGDFLISGTARRRKGLIDGFMYLKLKDFGLLCSPELPKTNLYQPELVDGYEAEGIKFTPIESMKKWEICYDGEMYDEKGEKRKIKLQAYFESNMPCFDFDTDMDPWLMAKCMAKEKWTRDYFETVKFIHQTHYEQPGDVNGTVIVDGVKCDLKLNSLRDHSFGFQREWRIFHRYGLHFVTTENGDRMNVGAICMPIGFSSLYVGYIYKASEDKIYPIQDCDLKLYQHGEEGTPPENYAFSFKAGEENYIMEVEVIQSPEFFLSVDCESRVVERLCKFKVNGKKGWGAAEWQYRNILGAKYFKK